MLREAYDRPLPFEQAVLCVVFALPTSDFVPFVGDPRECRGEVGIVNTKVARRARAGQTFPLWLQHRRQGSLTVRP